MGSHDHVHEAAQINLTGERAMHREPVPLPDEEPFQGEVPHPVPKDEPVRDPNPEVRKGDSLDY